MICFLSFAGQLLGTWGKNGSNNGTLPPDQTRGDAGRGQAWERMKDGMQDALASVRHFHEGPLGASRQGSAGVELISSSMLRGRVL